MLKLIYRYDRNSARLVVEGLPDKSIGQDSEIIGILSSWSLDLVGSPTLEGKKEHLNNLIKVILPYARNYLSGSPHISQLNDGPVNIRFCDARHHLLLKSSRDNVEPLQIILDDAELADLVNCIDNLILDKRVLLNWDVPNYAPLKFKFVSKNNISKVGLINSILGFSSLLIVSSLLIFISPKDTYTNSPSSLPEHKGIQYNKDG